MSLNHAQFEALFSGLDWRKVRALTVRPPTALLGHLTMPCQAMGRVTRIPFYGGIFWVKMIDQAMIDATDLPPSRDIACAMPCRAVDNIDVLKAMILAADGHEERHIDRIAQLEKLLADFKRALFGAKSEKADPGQFELALEDIEAAVESIQAAEEADDRQVEGKPRPRKANRGALPKHPLPGRRCLHR